MKLASIIPVLLCLGALVLSLLCLFAGTTKSFLEDYSIVTLNTSRIGHNLLNTTASSSNPFVEIFDNITDTLKKDLENDVADIAQALGLHDFYSIHILDFCEGYYTPAPVPNATLKKSSIHENVTSCSNTTAFFHFNPAAVLQQQLNASGHSNINLTDLDWPSEVTKGLEALKIAQRAVFLLYCIAIGLLVIAVVIGLLGICLTGRIAAFINVLVDWLAFLAIGIASAIVTAVMVKGTHEINHYGKDVGISATKGTKFLILTWVATGAVLLASVVWCLDCIVGRRHDHGGKKYTEETKYT